VHVVRARGADASDQPLRLDLLRADRLPRRPRHARRDLAADPARARPPRTAGHAGRRQGRGRRPLLALRRRRLERDLHPRLSEFTSFVHEGLTLQTNLFGSTFFVLTGFHGGHVTLGVIWLLTLLGLDLRGRLGTPDAVKVEVAGLYWHFVDVVWIVIFTLVYLIP